MTLDKIYKAGLALSEVLKKWITWIIFSVSFFLIVPIFYLVGRVVNKKNRRDASNWEQKRAEPLSKHFFERTG